MPFQTQVTDLIPPEYSGNCMYHTIRAVFQTHEPEDCSPAMRRAVARQKGAKEDPAVSSLIVTLKIVARY
jgi:hypothetical protein